MEPELSPFYLESFFFEESPESYLSPSRGAGWGCFDRRFDYEASEVCTRCMRRYGSVWWVYSVRRLDELTAGRRCLYVMTAWWLMEQPSK